MNGHRPIRYHRPASWKRSTGLGDDVSDLLGGDDPTSVSELVITASPASIATTPDAPILSPPIVLGYPTSDFYNAADDPSFNSNLTAPVFPSAAVTNPVTTFLQSLFPKAPKGAAAPPSSSSSNIQLKPGQPAASAAGAPMVNPELAAGLALVALIAAMALMAGHHDRRGSRRR